MEYDKDKVDEVTLALLYLVMHDEDEYGAKAWKGFDWDTMNRLHERGFIGNPVGKTKSVVVKLPALWAESFTPFLITAPVPIQFLLFSPIDKSESLWPCHPGQAPG